MCIVTSCYFSSVRSQTGAKWSSFQECGYFLIATPHPIACLKASFMAQCCGLKGDITTSSKRAFNSRGHHKQVWIWNYLAVSERLSQCHHSVSSRRAVCQSISYISHLSGSQSSAVVVRRILSILSVCPHRRKMFSIDFMSFETLHISDGSVS